MYAYSRIRLIGTPHKEDKLTESQMSIFVLGNLTLGYKKQK